MIVFHLFFAGIQMVDHAPVSCKDPQMAQRKESPDPDPPPQ
jgi:hypothetical protein